MDNAPQAGPGLWFDKNGEPLTDYNDIEAKFRDRDYGRVGDETIRGCRVSTVWLGLSQPWYGTKPALPLIFETMVFGGELDGEMERYPTLQEAKDGHVKWVERVIREEEKKHG